MRTVYHFSFLTAEVAKELWSAGFRDVDIPDEDYKTPLMIIGTYDEGPYARAYDEGPYAHAYDPRPALSWLIESALWLHGKGASLHRPHRYPTLNNMGSTAALPERRAIHFITAAARRYIFRAAGCEPRSAAEMSYAHTMEDLTDDLGVDARQFISQILLDTSSDACLCACARCGCMPMAFLLKRSSSFDRLDRDEHISAWIWRWLFDNVPINHFSTVNFREILRLRTFETLGLRHTCCHYDFGEFSSIESEEAAVIRDEDHEGIQLLETLLLEFEEKRGDETIKSFIDGYWRTRMDEVLAAREELVDRARTREIGVVLEDDDRRGDGDYPDE
ncbi:MAG: hypothetical protein Q9221_000774 [Calogaya cf. arnoldii]